ARVPSFESTRQLMKVFIRFLHQERSAGCRASSRHAVRLEHRNPDPGIGKAPRDGGASDAAADDRHIDLDFSLEARVSPLLVAPARGPQRARNPKFGHRQIASWLSPC